jgi:hypothetical protein
MRFLGLALWLSILWIPTSAFADYTINTTTENSSIAAFGNDSTQEYMGQQFTTVGAGTISSGNIKLSYDDSAPGDHVFCGIYIDGAGEPNGSSHGDSANFDASTQYPVFTSETMTWSSPVSVLSSTTYWLVCKRTGSIGAPYYVYSGAASATSPPSKEWNGSAWSIDKKTANINLFVVEGSTSTASTTATSTLPFTYQDWIFVNMIIIFLLALMALRILFIPLK